MLITVAKRWIALGGEWALPAGKTEAKALLKQHRAGLVIDYRVHADRVIGAFASEGAGKRVHSGALACAQIVPTAVIIQDLPDGRVWVAAVTDGIPLPNYDLVCTPEQAQQVMTDMLSFQPSATIIGSCHGATRTLESVLEELTPKQWANARLLPPRTTQLVRYALGAVTIAIAAGAGLYWLDQQKNQHRDAGSKQRQLAMLQSAEERDREQTRLQLLWKEQARQAIDAQSREFAMGATVVGALEAIRKPLQHAQIPRNGWRAAKLNCSIARGDCQTVWKSWQGMGTPARAAAGIPLAPTGLADLLVDPVVGSPQPFEVPRRAVGVADKRAALEFASVGKLYRDAGLTLASARKEVRVSLPTPPAGLTKPETIPAPVMGVIMDWQMSAPYHVVLAAAKKVQMAGVRVTSVDVSFDNVTAVSLTGQLLVE